MTLFDWITLAQGRMQVVSIATTRIYGLVKKGRFLEALFYRLNVVQLEARTTRAADSPAVDPPRMECRELDIGSIYS
jgi:transcriptional regulator of acetoin/glycerol metabolism